ALEPNITRLDTPHVEEGLAPDLAKQQVRVARPQRGLRGGPVPIDVALALRGEALESAFRDVPRALVRRPGVSVLVVEEQAADLLARRDSERRRGARGEQLARDSGRRVRDLVECIHQLERGTVRVRL